jgi:hypothetical protein
MIELFHATNDEASAEARRFVVEHDLLEKLRFRNVFYDEVRADLTARGGHDAPAIWDGEKLYEGRDAVMAFLGGL